MKKIKILFVHHGTGIGGAPINLINIILQLKAKGHICKVLLVKKSEAETLFLNNNIDYEIIDLPINYFIHNKGKLFSVLNPYKVLKTIFDWFFSAKIYSPRFLNKFYDFNILHIGTHGLTSLAFTAKKLNFKVVIHNQETVESGFLGIRRFILARLLNKNSDRIIDISKYNKSKLGIMSSNVLYNFVNIPIEYSTPFSKKKIKVLYLGGNSKIKGFKTAVDCLPYLNDNVVLQFAGTLNSWKSSITFKEKIINTIKLTIYRSTYLPLIKLLNSKNAEVLGQLINPYPYIDECDILITPFTVEHFSRPALEAFAYGKPVIGSNVEGMDEIIEHNINGLLVEKKNSRALANAINYLCENPILAQKMGKAGREKAKKIFSPEINIQKLERIYFDLIDK